MKTEINAAVLGAAVALILGASAQAGPANEAPPLGAILDLDGLPIPHAAPTEYSVDFVAGVSDTAITFAFREDPAYISFSNVSIVDLNNPGPNLLTNGSFTGLVYADNGNNFTPLGWTYANIYGAPAGGRAINGAWVDGAIQAYDAISQTIATNVGDSYQISFFVTEDSGLTNFSRLSTNGDGANAGGNGADILAYAQAGLPVSGVPEPMTWAMMLVGFAGMGAAVRRRRMGGAHSI